MGPNVVEGAGRVRGFRSEGRRAPRDRDEKALRAARSQATVAPGVVPRSSRRRL